MPKARPLRPWTTVSRREVFAAPPWITVHADRVRLPDGRVVDPYYRVDHPPHVVVFARTRTGRVVMERQYRHGVGRVCYVLPAGHIDRGERPLACARRELREETGYTARRWRSVGAFDLSGNRGGGKAHLFAAEGARKVAEPDSDDLEETEIVLLSLDEVVDLVRRGEVPVLGSAAAIALALLPP